MASQRDSNRFTFKGILSSAKAIYFAPYFLAFGRSSITLSSLYVLNVRPYIRFILQPRDYPVFPRKKDNHSTCVRLDAEVARCPDFLPDLVDCVKNHRYDGKTARKYFPIQEESL